MYSNYTVTRSPMHTTCHSERADTTTPGRTPGNTETQLLTQTARRLQEYITLPRALRLIAIILTLEAHTVFKQARVSKRKRKSGWHESTSAKQSKPGKALQPHLSHSLQ